MELKVIWTDEAIADLRQLVTFISRDNPPAAVKLGETIIEKSMMLANHPRLGRMLRIAPRDSLRELIVSPYRIIYEIDDAGRVILIRMLRHGARQEPEIN
jgi:toxin ParE1/3/4